MIFRRISLAGIFIYLCSFLDLSMPSVVYAQTSSTSQRVTWSCTGSPCSSGNSVSSNALVWPTNLGATSTRLGYTTSAAVYLPASAANGVTVRITAGTATVSAGTPSATSHRVLKTLRAGQSYTITGLAAGEVVSVQNANRAFSYALTLPTPTATATNTRTPTATAIPTPVPVSSQRVIWRCTGSPCSSGNFVVSNTLVWPTSWGATSTRLGYTTSAAVYLPASAANGVTVRITAGTATVSAGTPSATSHRVLKTLAAGQSYIITGLAAGEVVSVQNANRAFSYALTLPAATATPSQTATATEPTATATEPTATATEPTATATEPTATATEPTATATEPTATATEPTATATEPTATVPTELVAQQVTWNCTSSPCDWGSSATGYALVWPATLGATSSRLGYTTSAPIYLPASATGDLIIRIATGTATVYAGTPNATSHRVLQALTAGQSYVITGLAADEVVSVQNDTAVFSYELTIANATATPVTATAAPATATPTAAPTNGTTSQPVTWNCTGSPCSWGNSATGNALVWPATMGATSSRLGYTTSAPIYLPASATGDLVIQITAGTATVYAGTPNATSHRVLQALTAGQSYVITGLAANEVVSVQNDTAAFSYELSTSPVTPTPVGPTATPEPAACTDPANCNPTDSIESYWVCNTPGCTDANWVGAVISWPSWAAYEDNGRQNTLSRTVYSAQGELLYPYMGSWADGCQVTVVSGTVLIIEWERGTNVWRETLLESGQSHTIDLTAPEDGAMIEGLDYSPGFSVSLTNCTPQVIRNMPIQTEASTPVTVEPDMVEEQVGP